MRVESNATTVIIRDQSTRQVLWTGPTQDGIYKLSDLSSLTGSALSDLWHFKYGHFHIEALRHAAYAHGSWSPKCRHSPWYMPRLHPWKTTP